MKFNTQNVSLIQIKQWAINNKADIDFVEVTIPTIYNKCLEVDFNPLFAIAQSTKETGWGHFRGQVKKEQNNVCGLSDDVNGGFHSFESIEGGVDAFIEHLCLYMGYEGYPLDNPIDPKHYSYLYNSANTYLKVCKEWTREHSYVEYYTRVMEMMEEMEDTIIPLEDEVEGSELDKLKLENKALKEQIELLKKGLLGIQDTLENIL